MGFAIRLALNPQHRHSNPNPGLSGVSGYRNHGEQTHEHHQTCRRQWFRRSHRFRRMKGLTLHGLRDWLATYDDKEVVGERDNCALCPLAKYLRTVYATNHIAVGHGRYTVAGTHVDLPEWAQDFIARIDDSRAESVTTKTAKRALKLATRNLT